MDMNDLRTRVQSITVQARGKLDEIKDDTPAERAAEIEREFDAMMADADALQARSERLAKLDNLSKILDRPTAPAARGANGTAQAVDGGSGPSYREAFHAYLRAEGNLGNMDPEERAVLRTGYSSVESRAQTTTPAAGGYTVPTELMNEIIVSMAAFGPMYDPTVTRELVTVGGGTLTMPTINDTSVVAVPHTEGVALTDDGGSDVTFGQKVLNAYAFNTEWLRVSKELADDSIFAMESLLSGLLGERLGRIANSQLTTGTGSSAPNGIMTASTLGVTAVATAAITADEIIDLEHSVDPAYRVGPQVAFMFNDSTLKAIRKLKDGEGNYLLSAGDITRGVTPTLLGYRYVINQAVASLATGNRVMVFGDFGKYIVRKVGQPLIGAISDKDFWPGFGIAGYIRFDGELMDTAAVKHMITA